jgi:hypothetical protein
MGLLERFKERAIAALGGKTTYIMTQDGNISINNNGKVTQVSAAHPNHARIAELLQNGKTEGLAELLDVPAMVMQRFEDVSVDVYGQVFYKGNQVHGVICNKIMTFMKAGEDFGPLARFLSNLMKNPSEDSRNELYDFLTNGNMPITEDGCFLAYKGVNPNYNDCHTGKIDNSPGAKPSRMKRDDVDPDRRKACSNGYHVGSFNYASGFGQRLMIVKVNPADAVSVPYDHSCEKLRVTYYEVLSEVPQNEGDDPGWKAMDVVVYRDEDDSLYFDEGMRRWRDYNQQGRIVSHAEAASRGFSR